MFNLPTPHNALGRAIERFFLIAVAAGVTDYMTHASTGAKTGAAYFALKTFLDILNSNIPNTGN
jgi:hypothetical protein